MIKSLSVTSPRFVSPFEWDLRQPFLSGYNIKNIQGIGGFKTNLRLGDSAWRDGSIFSGSRAGDRNIVLTLGLAHRIDDVEPLRQKLYQIFPLGSEVQLQFNTDRRSVAILCRVESVEGSIFTQNQEIQVSLIAPWPYFYDVGGSNTQSMSPFGYKSSGFEFPFMNDSLTTSYLTFSDSYEVGKASNTTIYYDGDVPAGLLFRMTSLVHGSTIPVIQNSDKSIYIAGGKSTFVTGGTVWVNTSPENMYARIGTVTTPTEENNWGLLDPSTTMGTIGYGSNILYMSDPSSWKVDVFYQTLRYGV